MEPLAASVTTADVPPADVVRAHSFEQVFAAESAAMLRLAVGLVDMPERAEEIVQDAFEKTLLAWHRVRDPAAFLRTAVVNGCRSELRRRRVMRRHPLPSAGTTELDESDGALLAAIARLTPKRRIAITLRYYADLPEAEIAAAMGVRPGTVKSLISRALADLRASDLRRVQP
jgi:RNA polymerase sigma factor (sigma-70 family)